MKKLIQGYVDSCELVRGRINELTKNMNELKKSGGEAEIEELKLEQRISLLYTEHRQMQEIIVHLTAYMRRVEQRVKKNDLL